MVEFLICEGADVRSTMSSGDTLLHLAMTGYNELKCLELVKILIEVGCDPTTVNSECNSGLEVAIDIGHTSVVEFLLSQGCLSTQHPVICTTATLTSPHGRIPDS